jgi:hypothetical protein
MADDLFRPTIRERPVSGKRPWRPESIFYPAFFGGPLAAATLGLLNGRRLRIPGAHLALIAVAGLVAFGVRVGLSLWLAEGNSGVRLAGSVTGALAWLAVLSTERRPFRAYTYADGEPAGLVGPGFAAVIGLGLTEAIIIFALLAATGSSW